jgi:hypothetical protein
MDLKKQWSVIVIVAVIITAGTVAALMPPHVDGIVPENDGTLEGDTVVLTGYSLGYADADAIQVIDVATGESAPIHPDLDCRWEGKGDCPGCRQQACTLTIRLLSPVSGHTYEFRFLDKTYRFTVAPKSD